MTYQQKILVLDVIFLQGFITAKHDSGTDLSES